MKIYSRFVKKILGYLCPSLWFPMFGFYPNFLSQEWKNHLGYMFLNRWKSCNLKMLDLLVFLLLLLLHNLEGVRFRLVHRQYQDQYHLGFHRYLHQYCWDGLGYHNLGFHRYHHQDQYHLGLHHHHNQNHHDHLERFRISKYQFNR